MKRYIVWLMDDGFILARALSPAVARETAKSAGHRVWRVEICQQTKTLSTMPTRLDVETQEKPC